MRLVHACLALGWLMSDPLTSMLYSNKLTCNLVPLCEFACILNRIWVHTLVLILCLAVTTQVHFAHLRSLSSAILAPRSLRKRTIKMSTTKKDPIRDVRTPNPFDLNYVRKAHWMDFQQAVRQWFIKHTAELCVACIIIAEFEVSITLAVEYIARFR
jgi:hypothetical protein